MGNRDLLGAADTQDTEYYVNVNRIEDVDETNIIALY